MPIPSPSAARVRVPLRDEVAQRLRAAIVDGTLAPGERLKDGEVAEWLGVSRTPVREAILELTASGLVRSDPGRSPVVAPVDTVALQHARTVVAAMHRAAVRDGWATLRERGIPRMRAANDAFADAHGRGDVDAAIRADDEFHAVAIDACDNDAVRSVLDTYTPALRRAERLRFSSEQGAASVARHARLIELCERDERDAACALVEEIWTDLVDDSLAALEPPHGDSPAPRSPPAPTKRTPPDETARVPAPSADLRTESAPAPPPFDAASRRRPGLGQA